MYMSRQLKQLRDPSLMCFASEENSENCPRKAMLRSLGSSEPVTSGPACCDTCSGAEVPSPRLDFLVTTPLRRPRKPKPVRHITDEMADDLPQALIHEREKLVEAFSGYRMIGSSFIFSDGTVKELCRIAAHIQSIDKLDDIAGLRAEFKSRVFSVIQGVVSCAPSPKNKRSRK